MSEFNTTQATMSCEPNQCECSSSATASSVASSTSTTTNNNNNASTSMTVKNIANKESVTVKRVKSSKAYKALNTIPEDILNNVALNEAISMLPKNYNFEIHKCIWKARDCVPGKIALQFPEGLLMYACLISDILERFTGRDMLILGDVTYGACCVDDFTAAKLGAVLLIHYGHSCLVPINKTSIKVLYVFVEIQFDPSHLIDTIRQNFDPTTKIALMGTVQFTNVLHGVLRALSDTFKNINIAQAKPLSSGETLGCTSSILVDTDALVFVADGRFHLEAAMIQNPSIEAYRYDPYSKVLTSEGYDTERMKKNRHEAIVKAQSTSASTFGVILGTLGRQGNTTTFDRIKKKLRDRGKTVIPFLMAEIHPTKLLLLEETIDVWVQVACPRLSIDWGDEFKKPVLTPYELEVCLGDTAWKDVYPMDYYRNASGEWGNYYEQQQRLAERKAAKRVAN